MAAAPLAVSAATPRPHGPLMAKISLTVTGWRKLKVIRGEKPVVIGGQLSPIALQ